MEESWGLQDYSDHKAIYSVDPVCGLKLDVAKAPYRTGYAGEMFYFCCVDCQTRFEEDPARYIGQRR